MRRLLLTCAVLVACAIGAVTIGLAGCGGKTDSTAPTGKSPGNPAPVSGTSIATSAPGEPTAGKSIPEKVNSPGARTDPRLASCQLWLQGVNTAVAQSLPVKRQAQQNAATAAAEDPAWADVSQSMQVLVGLPPTGLSPDQVTQARNAVGVITSSCAALGVHIPK